MERSLLRVTRNKDIGQRRRWRKYEVLTRSNEPIDYLWADDDDDLNCYLEDNCPDCWARELNRF